MRHVDTGELQAGMVLAEAVRGPRGDVLLGEGVELSERHLKAFKTWGIRTVVVEGEESAQPGTSAAATELPPELLAQARAAIAARFARAGTGHPLLAFLSEEAVRRLAAELQEKK
jgi:hypothetical protein